MTPEELLKRIKATPSQISAPVNFNETIDDFDPDMKVEYL
jgi:hypothetical protein